MRYTASDIGGMLFEGDHALTGLREYCTSIVATAMIGVIVCALVENAKIRSILRITTGILVLIVLLRPLVNLDPEDLSIRIQSSIEGQIQTENYQELYRKKLKEQIQTTTEKYIRDKASALGAHIEAFVTLSDDTYPVPTAVEIMGKMTEMQKEELADYLTHQLGIPPHNQRWNIND